jgi:hypothetical protein
MNTRETIEQWTQETHKDLIANYKRLGLKASGKWESDLESKIEEKPGRYIISFLGSKHSQFMVNGRLRNASQTPESIRAFVGWAGSTFLAQWVKDKGLNISPFAVAYKIARQGIKVPNRFNSGTLLSDIINDQRISDLLGDIMGVMVNEIRTDIKQIVHGS